jgi:hypothetical protein
VYVFRVTRAMAKKKTENETSCTTQRGEYCMEMRKTHMYTCILLWTCIVAEINLVTVTETVIMEAVIGT